MTESQLVVLIKVLFLNFYFVSDTSKLVLLILIFVLHIVHLQRMLMTFLSCFLNKTIKLQIVNRTIKIFLI